MRFDEVLFFFPGKLQTLGHNYNIPSKNWDKRRHVFLLIGVMLTNSNKKYANNPLIKKLHFYMFHGKQFFVAVVCMKYTINVSVRQIIPSNQNISTYNMYRYIVSTVDIFLFEQSIYQIEKKAR